MTPALAACLALHVAALMVLFGAAALARGDGRAPAEGAPWRFLPIGVGVALVTAFAWPWLLTASLSDEPWRQVSLQEAWTVLTQTSFGRTWLMHAAAVVIAGVACLRPGLAAWNQATWAALALGSLGLVGHAAGASGWAGVIQQVSQGVHLLAAGAWLGALPLLWWRLRTDTPEANVLGLERFSAAGIKLVLIVAATGAYVAWQRFAAWDDLWDSAYGRLLVAKVGLVGVMGLAALNNRNRLLPALRLADPSALSRLQTSIGVEILCGLAVLAAAAVLGQLEPPR